MPKLKSSYMVKANTIMQTAPTPEEECHLYSIGTYSFSTFSGRESPLPEDIRMDDEVSRLELFAAYSNERNKD